MSFWPDAARARRPSRCASAAAAEAAAAAAPDERDAAEQRATTEQEQPAARRRRHESVIPLWMSGLGVAPLVEALAHRRQGVVVRVVEVAASAARARVRRRASGRCFASDASLHCSFVRGTGVRGRVERVGEADAARRRPATLAASGGSAMRSGAGREEACTARRIATCCASTPMMLAVTERRSCSRTRRCWRRRSAAAPFSSSSASATTSAGPVSVGLALFTTPSSTGSGWSAPCRPGASRRR